MHQKTTQRQNRFGRIKPDGVPAVRLAAPIGMAAAAGIGAAIAGFCLPPMVSWTLAAVFAFAAAAFGTSYLIRKAGGR